jgi:hypothetical protein
MSRSRILHAMSGALRDLLWDGLRHGGPDLLPSRESIVFDSPAQAMGNAEARLSLWLCHVSPDSVSSVPRVRDDDPRRAAQLSLHYLLTPLTASTEHDLLLLGGVLQAFHDNPVATVRGSDGAQPLRTDLEAAGYPELNRIWRGLRQPLRLSLAYRVRGVRLEANPGPNR